jgi:hypothetical protein
MTQFARYDDEGRILFMGDVPADLLPLQGEQIVIADDVHPERHYVVDGQLTLRPANPARIHGTELNGLPRPCDIVINGRAYACADGHAQLEFTYPGTYRVVVRAFPFVDATFEVTV